MHVARPGGSALLLFVHFEDEVAGGRRQAWAARREASRLEYPLSRTTRSAVPLLRDLRHVAIWTSMSGNRDASFL